MPRNRAGAQSDDGRTEGFGVAALLSRSLVLARAVMRRRSVAWSERERRSEKLEAVGRMTAHVAHDLNNILTIVAGNLQLAERGTAADRNTRRQLAAASAAIRRGIAMTSQLLAFAQRQAAATQTANVNVLLTDLEHVLRSAAGGEIEVALHLAEDLRPCRVDPVQFDFAMLNLVVNARDAMRPGGRIDISTSNEIGSLLRSRNRLGDDAVRVTVTDNGKGMSNGTARRALEPFYTTKGADGTGLGLSQVSSSMKAIGGDIAIETQPDIGTTIHLGFPCRAGDMILAADRAADPERAAGHTSS
jgi:signal transduction histidine kinase